jgi:hypothetical protein
MSPHPTRLARLFVTCAVGLGTACSAARDSSSENSGSEQLPAGQGRLAVALVDAPNPDVSQIVVNITKVTAHSTAAGWVTVSPASVTPATPLTVDLLTLQGTALDLGFLNLPPGTITQIRLYVSRGDNHVVLTDSQASVPLKVPSGSESGIKINGPWEIAACSQTTVTLDFDGKKSIWYHPAHQESEWILRPVIRTKKILAVATGCSSGDDAGSGTSGPQTCDPSAAQCPQDFVCTAVGESAVCLGSPDAPCTWGNECVNGTCDPTTARCQGGLGAPCGEASACVIGTCVAGTCAPGGADEPCGKGDDCESGICSEGACTAPSTAGGTDHPCTVATQLDDCYSRACGADLTCEPGGQGDQCELDGDCQEGTPCVFAGESPTGTCVTAAQ